MPTLYWNFHFNFVTPRSARVEYLRYFISATISNYLITFYFSRSLLAETEEPIPERIIIILRVARPRAAQNVSLADFLQIRVREKGKQNVTRLVTIAVGVKFAAR